MSEARAEPWASASLSNFHLATTAQTLSGCSPFSRIMQALEAQLGRRAQQQLRLSLLHCGKTLQTPMVLPHVLDIHEEGQRYDAEKGCARHISLLLLQLKRLSRTTTRKLIFDMLFCFWVLEVCQVCFCIRNPSLCSCELFRAFPATCLPMALASHANNNPCLTTTHLITRQEEPEKNER